MWSAFLSHQNQFLEDTIGMNLREHRQWQSTSPFLVVVSILISTCWAQENAQTRIPLSLAECYEDPYLLNRDNRLPLTLNTLIELIRKVEDTPGFNQDIRQMAAGLLQRFRLDGIEQAPGVLQSSAVLPYSPSGFQFSKHRLLLSRLIPGNALNFPNETLTPIERVRIYQLLNEKSKIFF